MKKSALLIATVLLITSCSQSKENKAKKAIDEHMKATLNDYKSYEPVKFEKIDSVFTTLEFSDPYFNHQSAYKWQSAKFQIDIRTLNDYISDGVSVNRASIDEYKKITQAEVDSMKYYDGLMSKDSAAFKPTFKGWSVVHSYRAKNKLGALVLATSRFTLTKNMDSVIGKKDID